MYVNSSYRDLRTLRPGLWESKRVFWNKWMDSICKGIKNGLRYRKSGSDFFPLLCHYYTKVSKFQSFNINPLSSNKLLILLFSHSSWFYVSFDCPLNIGLKVLFIRVKTYLPSLYLTEHRKKCSCFLPQSDRFSYDPKI